ncbi:MAG: amidophosphoribosyltransferase [Candidatus Adiutrix sp.]|jgi:amidophosphoribosyltransferase|nr:amidophosphoribosyltransferase [Candidatus Adiutrix sp.]
MTVKCDLELKPQDVTSPRWKEECGVAGVWAPGRSVVDLCYLGLFALQHRGQESAGLAVTDGLHIDMERGMGLMREAFRHRLPSLKGHAAIGHVRYSTCGASLFNNIQPIFAYFSGGFICLAHNGSLTNAPSLRRRLEKDGCVFQTGTDTEAILNLIARDGAQTTEEKIAASLQQIEGAYSLTIMTGDRLIGVRDPYGFRPLCLGSLPGGGYVLASESCALDAAGAEFIRDVAPGEMLIIDRDGLHSRIIGARPRLARCVFEYIYFARPDSVLDGLSVWQARYRLGQQLAREFTGAADMVTPVPDTGITAALGFAAESGLPYVEGLIKNRYVGRTFILPDQAERQSTVEMKLNPIRANLKDKRVVLVDDSLVRGTTSASLISLIRRAGAGEVHFCISSPPITHPCYYGIDTAVRKELIASHKTVDEIRRIISADGLQYLSRPGLMGAVGDPEEKLMCGACFSGEYPTSVKDVENKECK